METQGGGATPTSNGDHWTYQLPATGSPANVRRSETHWGTMTSGPVRNYADGDTVTFEGDYTGTLGAAAASPNDWHVIYQLHGATNGQWPGPALSLSVRGGRMILGGGTGHPDHDWETANFEWRQDVGAWVDGQTRRIKVVTRLSSNPDVGTVSVWIDGNLALDRYKPSSADGTGHRAGTIYPGQPIVVSRSGLYRGSQGTTPPSYLQVMNVRVISLG